MLRHVAVIASALCLSSSLVFAQGTTLTVSAASANVHKFPSIGSPVIGKAPRGTALQVTRELGDWVRVSWPGGEEGAGFVRMSVGSMANGSAAQSKMVTRGSAAPAPAAVSRTSAAVSPAPADQSDRTIVTRQPQLQSGLVSPPTHFIGLGVRAGGQSHSSIAFGAGARVWTRGPLGAQLEVSRYSITSAITPGEMTSWQIAPSVLYAFRDRVSDYMWIRPYAGAGARIYRSSLTGTAAGLTVSDSAVGMQAFGGGELTFASVPRFALSVDAGYYSSQTPIPGFEVGGIGFTVAGHWYLK